MATVTVLTADRIIEFENLDIVGGVVDATGDLILTKRDGTSVNLGNVKLHSQLFGLEQDDHVQYALADGSRGAFATPAQGALADNARPNRQATITIAGGDNDYVEIVTIDDDGTTTDTWVNRLEYYFNPNGASPRHTTFLNEYGELRVAPAKENTVAARFFVKEFPDNPLAARSATVPVIEMMDDRTNRNSLWGVVGDGTTVVNNIRMAYTLVLGPADSVPVGTPAGTVIVRTT